MRKNTYNNVLHVLRFLIKNKVFVSYNTDTFHLVQFNI